MNLSFKEFLRQRLDESRTDYVVQNFGQKALAAAQDDHSAKFDTAEELVNYLASHISEVNIAWVTRMYIQKQFKIEDAARIKQELVTFGKFKSKVANKDLNSYKSLDQLYDVLEPFQDAEEPVSKKAIAKAVKLEGADVIIDTPDLKVISPKNEEAACLYGSGTKWCTAAKNVNQFNAYNKNGRLYIILAKLNGKDRKFQLHYESNSFMNEHDTIVSKADIAALSKLDGYKQFLNYMIKKHYGEHLK